MLLKFYLLLPNLAVWKFHEDEIGNGTCIGSLYFAVIGKIYSKSVWGYCFICGIGTPRPGSKIKQNTFSTPFLCTNFNRFNGRWETQIFLIMNEKNYLIQFDYGEVEHSISILSHNAFSEKNLVTKVWLQDSINDYILTNNLQQGNCTAKNIRLFKGSDLIIKVDEF